MLFLRRSASLSRGLRGGLAKVGVWVAAALSLSLSSASPSPASVMLAVPAGSAGTLAVVVNPGVPVDDLSFAEIRKVFMGDRQFWSGNLRVIPFVPAVGSAEREVLLKKIYEKDEAQYRSYWIAKVFRTEATAPPKVASSEDMAADLIRRLPGAIGLIDSARIPAGVKVLRIDGKLPSDTHYPLR